MSDTAIKEAMDYEKQFATNNKLKSAYWEHERTMRDIASALYSREKQARNAAKRLVIRQDARHSVLCFKSYWRKAGKKNLTVSCEIMSTRKNYCENII